MSEAARTWLMAAAAVVALAVGVEIARWVLGPVLRPVGGVLRRFYTPPHGGVALIATWAAAIGAFWASFTVGPDRTGLAAALALGGPLAALVATLVYRDQRRESRGLPPVITEVPSKIGPIGRVMLGTGAAASLMLGVFLSLTLGWQAWEPVAGMVVVSGVTGYAAVRARYPAVLVNVLGARKRL